MSSYFTQGANIPWSRDGISGCNCNEKCTDTYTLLALHAMEGQLTEKCGTWTLEKTCQLTSTSYASVVNSGLDNDSHFSDDISFEDVGDCDQPVEDEFGRQQ